MGLRVNTNVASLNAQRHLYDTTTRFSKSMERLSSGLRINRSGDDAAGLAISESLKSDIRALQQASRNAADGISLVQTAEGSLDEVNSILLRLRELAEQAATETLGEDERVYLNNEFQELLDEINRISLTAEFNGIKLLDGTVQTLEVQVGIGTDAATSAVSIDLNQAMSAQALDLTAGITSITGTNGDAARGAIGLITEATGVVSSMRANFGAAQNRFETSIRNIGMTAENLAAANSRIRDVDVALETSTMTSLQILQQAGVSILAQANMTSQLALNLLQG
ncbi:MAG: flagellin FliC [bacterium]|jgi:flagellin|nr:flagellin FliC [bacterium]MBK7671596.1 flagellin FliC [bacterium]